MGGRQLDGFGLGKSGFKDARGSAGRLDDCLDFEGVHEVYMSWLFGACREGFAVELVVGFT